MGRALANGDKEDLVQLVGNLPLFERMDGGVLAAVAAASRKRRVIAHERVFWQGDVPHAFFYVLAGHVRRGIVSSSGDEKLIDVITPRHYFGLTELFGNGRYLSSAATVDAVLLLEIGRDGLSRAMDLNREFSQRVLAAVAERHLALEQEIAATYFHSGCRRLLDYLLTLAGGRLDAPGDQVIALPISKRLLAERIGVTAETLSRAFRDLSEAGLVSVHGRNITLLAKLSSRLRDGTGTEPAESTGEVPGHPRRRRADPWIEQAALTAPLGSRAWL